LQVSSTDLADRPVPILVGNGELVTTLHRHGYHSTAEGQGLDTRTQRFVLAGRRHAGPDHQLVDFGALTRTLTCDGAIVPEEPGEQVLDLDLAEVRSRTFRGPVLESTRSLIALDRNLFFVETTVANTSREAVEARLEIRYRVTDPDLQLAEGLRFSTHDNLGQIEFRHDGPGDTRFTADGAHAEHAWRLPAGESATVRTWLAFSDRFRYQPEVGSEEVDAILAAHREAWRQFWSRSAVEIGDETVERFRAMSLYTIRCQATPWSIPPTVSKPYWDGGTFHDEMYPFLGLTSAGHADIARNVPYYRLATLPSAIERAGGRGALYAWSATETGEERDPHGHWYTERFHLGQIAVSAWWQWLHGEDLLELEDLFPVLRELARYFELQMIEKDEKGNPRLRPCTDFDESVGMVSGGPMTVGAAIFTLEHAALAARRLGRERERCRRWERLAHKLRDTVCVNRDEKRYEIPNGKPLHSSIIGLIAPFFVDVGSDYARNSARLIHAVRRTESGWQPGLHEAFEGTTWMWTAGHLGMCHSVLGDGDRAWECVREGPKAAGQFWSPNEHLDAEGRPIVPWFTTGCGAWLTALHWMFVRVDDDGLHLLPAVPASLSSFRFRGLGAKGGVSVTCAVEEGKLRVLELHSPVPQPVAFEVPKRHVRDEALALLGDFDDFGDRWRFRVSLQPGANRLVG
jgi:hypothetical protein